MSRPKLIEVALPLDAINHAATRERGKPVIAGHPRGLHLWWSRKPLTICRAVLFASLVEDPSSVPEEFPDTASQERERKRLFDLVEALVASECEPEPAVLVAARREIARSLARHLRLPLPHDRDLLAFLRQYGPTVYDPFSGGGAIPLEAVRLGLRTMASDLNPVAVLITKATLELPARFPGLAEDIRTQGSWMHQEALRRVGHLYPPVAAPAQTGKRQARVLAWRWARTVLCPNPACGSEIPLVWSFSLGDGKGWIQPLPDRARRRVDFAVKLGKGTPPPGTSSRRGADCLCCGMTAPIEHVREAGRSGRMGVRLLGMVAEASKGRAFLPPDDEQDRVARSAAPHWRPEMDLVPNSRHVTPVVYGMTRHADLYSERQLLVMGTLADLVQEAHARLLEAGCPRDRADAVATYLALAVSRIADYNSTLCTWDGKGGRVRNTFARQALPMTWDYVEVNPLADSSGSFLNGVESIAKVVERLPSEVPDATAFQHDAAENLPGEGGYLVCTDPPYYDNVPYADLSDYFYVWLRRALHRIHPDLLATVLAPKAPEIVADALRHGGKSETKTFFESRMAQVVRNLRQRGDAAYPLTIYYAFKQSETDEGADGLAASTGWESMLASLEAGGFQQDGTWPLRTELTNRMRSLKSNTLASSIVLVCRRRPEDAPAATLRDFVSALRAELPVALGHLQGGNIAPVDLAQAAIGPGMAVFTRYSKVLNAAGKPLSMREALGLINQVLDEVLVQQEGDFDPDTRWALAWFEQFGFTEGEFGVAETLSKAKNTSVSGIVEAGVAASKAGKVRLLRPSELPGDWDPTTDTRLTVWEMVHHLVRALDSGEVSAAALVAKLGSQAEVARELAYRLYSVCDRKKRPAEALGYNALVQCWPELLRLGHRLGVPGGSQLKLEGL